MKGEEIDSLAQSYLRDVINGRMEGRRRKVRKWMKITRTEDGPTHEHKKKQTHEKEGE